MVLMVDLSTVCGPRPESFNISLPTSRPVNVQSTLTLVVCSLREKRNTVFCLPCCCYVGGSCWVEAHLLKAETVSFVLALLPYVALLLLYKHFMCDPVFLIPCREFLGRCQCSCKFCSLRSKCFITLRQA